MVLCGKDLQQIERDVERRLRKEIVFLFDAEKNLRHVWNVEYDIERKGNPVGRLQGMCKKQRQRLETAYRQVTSSEKGFRKVLFI